MQVRLFIGRDYCLFCLLRVLKQTAGALLPASVYQSGQCFSGTILPAGHVPRSTSRDSPSLALTYTESIHNRYRHHLSPRLLLPPLPFAFTSSPQAVTCTSIHLVLHRLHSAPLPTITISILTYLSLCLSLHYLPLPPHHASFSTFTFALILLRLCPSPLSPPLASPLP